MFVIPGNKRAPFIRLVIPLIAGIVLQLYGSWSLSSLLQMTGFTIVCLCLYCYLPLSFRFLYGWIQGVLLYLLIGCCGALLLYQSDIRRQKSYFGTIINDSSRLVLRIEESLEEKPHSWKTTATITGILSGNRWQPAKGMVLLYFAKDSTPPDLQYGHQLLLANRLQPVSRSGNPGVFDYRQYCAYQQIYYQAYLQRKDWYRLPEQQGNVFMQLVLHCRHYCLAILKKYIGNGPEGGMAQALLIGYRQELDKTMVQTYTNTGIVHIIAISGMHVGLIYISLVWLLQWLPINTATRLIKAMLLILLLWSFAFLTGGAAAVLRAVVTFTALAIGKFLLERDSSSYNTLAASAFLLLCYNPHFITDVGFVLSYLAVLGILLFYKPIYDAWSVKNQWLDKLWKIVALSLAAQILTLPACLFYFHQFPNYFLLANIVAVPLSSLIIYGEILLLLFAGIPGVAVYLGIGVKYLIVLMNTWVAWLNELPYGLVENIHINSYQTICMYLFLAALAAWYFYKWKKGLHVALTMLLLCSLLHVVNIIQSSQQRKIIIYNVPKYTAIDFIVGHSVHFAGDTSLWQTAVAQQLHTTRSYLRVSTGRIPQLAQVGGYFRFGQKQLVVIDRPLPGKPVDKKFRTDYILLSHNPKVAIKQLSDFFEFDYLIFDASNSFWKIQQWKNDCYALTLRCFSVPDQGAYVINF
jgi:competence protein ComEC